ncbi:hypothetical protein GCM10010371_44840 [Streptomyces subrutilus]|uniref:Alkaline shock response membrane anchor protein AmaP n=1 Tax=Streptomyces subrutilus TaxID=36818 RepID=A0A5P2UW21_9ACTN|nr:hypothetical protein [Streptomyces subrutilus]QEU81724.1 hypothetical protein CP968_28625 [Streptomyces subrutilus]GGZ80341.1 hypothetical protein GCM10010371_44840 [Streptomyces subrutilus]
MPRARNAVNRIVLAGAGVLLLAGGAGVLAADPALSSVLPDRVPRFADGSRPVDPAALADWRRLEAWTPGVGAGLLVVALLAAALLLLQARRGRVRRLPLERPGAELSTGALREAVEDGLDAVPGVERASVRITGRPAEPVLRIALDLADTARPAEVAARVADTAVAGARAFLAPRRVRAEVRCTVRRGVPPRAR